MTAKRVNVTLEESLHETATNYADAMGLSFSAFVSRALRDAMSRGDSSPSSGQVVLSSDVDEVIDAKVEAALMDFLTSDKSDSLFERIASKMQVAHTEVSPGPAHVPQVKAGHVEITSDFLSRLKKFKPTPLMNASGVNKGSISEIQNGKKAGVTKDTFDKLEAGLIALEEAAARNSLNTE